MVKIEKLNRRQVIKATVSLSAFVYVQTLIATKAWAYSPDAKLNAAGIPVDSQKVVEIIIGKMLIEFNGQKVRSDRGDRPLNGVGYGAGAGTSGDSRSLYVR